jgi:hypothetical protein
MEDDQLVWVFNAERARFPGGIFSSLDKAEAWISKHGLTGLLTGYPLDEGAYEWATRRGFFSPKRDDQRTAEFIASFASGRYHHHYEAGERVA